MGIVHTGNTYHADERLLPDSRITDSGSIVLPETTSCWCESLSTGDMAGPERLVQERERTRILQGPVFRRVLTEIASEVIAEITKLHDLCIPPHENDFEGTLKIEPMLTKPARSRAEDLLLKLRVSISTSGKDLLRPYPLELNIFPPRDEDADKLRQHSFLEPLGDKGLDIQHVAADCLVSTAYGNEQTIPISTDILLFSLANCVTCRDLSSAVKDLDFEPKIAEKIAGLDAEERAKVELAIKSTGAGAIVKFITESFGTCAAVFANFASVADSDVEALRFMRVLVEGKSPISRRTNIEEIAGNTPLFFWEHWGSSGLLQTGIHSTVGGTIEPVICRAETGGFFVPRSYYDWLKEIKKVDPVSNHGGCPVAARHKSQSRNDPTGVQMLARLYLKRLEHVLDRISVE